MHTPVAAVTSRCFRLTTLTALAAAAVSSSTGCVVGDDGSVDDAYARKCGRGGGPKAFACPDAAPPAPMADAAPLPPDAAPPPPEPDAAPPPPPPPADCDPEVTTTTSGKHNAGKDCYGCHDGSSAAPRWYVSGTLYDTVTGSAAIAGATVHVTDAAGKQLTLITSDNGNFYSSTAVSYPLSVSISRCPDNAAMSSTVSSPASCNACHDSTFRIHLP